MRRCSNALAMCPTVPGTLLPAAAAGGEWSSRCLLPPNVLLFSAGFEVLASASHYWPLEHVDGIHELQDTTGGRCGW